MPHKVVLIPVLSSVFDFDFVYQASLRSITAFGNEKRQEKWNSSIEYSLLIPGKDETSSAPFTSFHSSDSIKSGLENCSPITDINACIKKTLYYALALPWGNAGVFSPVKKKNENVVFQWINSIILIGDFDETFTKEIAKTVITNHIVKNLRTENISLIHVSEKYTESPFPEPVLTIRIDDYPTKRLYDAFQLQLLYITNPTSSNEPLFPETPQEAKLFINEEDSISVATTGDVQTIKPVAKLDCDVLTLLVPHFDVHSAIGYVFKRQKIPAYLIDQLLVVSINGEVKCLFYLYRSSTKYIFHLKPLSVLGQVKNGSPRRVIINQRRRNVGGVLHPHFALHDTSIDPKIQSMIIASNQKHGGGFLRGRIDQLGKLNRKNDFNSFNIMPTKLRVRATPTKTPMKTELTPLRRGAKKICAEPIQTRELKKLSRHVPTSLSELVESTDTALKHNSFGTAVRLTLNYAKKEDNPPIKSIAKTKNTVMIDFGGSDQLEYEIKKNVLFHLLDSKTTDEENFKNLTELMRWLTFSTSSVKMISFFNEDVIPILIEYNDGTSIQRLVKAYQDLFILIPKILQSYASDDNTSSEESDNEPDQEDIVSLGRSSSIGASVSSIYSNIFSNPSSVQSSNVEYGQVRKSTIQQDSRPLKRLSAVNRIMSVKNRRQSEPVRFFEVRSQSISDLIPSHNGSGTDDGRKPKTDKAKRALFSSPIKMAHTSGGHRRSKTLKLKSTTAKDTPSKNQVYTKSERLKEMVKRRTPFDGSRMEQGISVIGESPERKTKFAAANPDLSICDVKHKSLLFQRAFSADQGLNKSALDLFSPPKSKQFADSLLFGSGSDDQSTDEEIAIGPKDSILYSPPFKSISMTAESPIAVKPTVYRTPGSVKKHRRNLFHSAEKGEPANRKDEKDVFNEKIEALQNGRILTPQCLSRSRINGSVQRARRQLKLSESEK